MSHQTGILSPGAGPSQKRILKELTTLKEVKIGDIVSFQR